MASASRRSSRCGSAGSWGRTRLIPTANSRLVSIAAHDVVLLGATGYTGALTADLGTRLTVEALPEGVPLRVGGFVRAGGLPSGGSCHTAVTAFSRVRQMVSAHAERRRAEPEPDARRVRPVRPAPRRERAVN